MKKRFLAVAAFMFLCPIASWASPVFVGTGELVLSPSGPNVYKYLGDYDVSSYVYKSGKRIEFAADNSPDNMWEAFCVSPDHLNPLKDTFSFYTSDILGVNTNFVTWVANWVTTHTSAYDEFDTQDEVKALGQAVIWNTLGVIPSNQYTTAKNWFLGMYNNDKDNQSDYANDWLVALNGGLGDCRSNQDFLIKADPVPEPTTMLLFGAGLAGLAAVGRRRKN